MAPPTVAAILRRHQVPSLRERHRLTGQVIRASKTSAARDEHHHPGSLAHVAHIDVKKIGRIPDGGGWPAHGRQRGQSGAHKRAKIGFDDIHSLTDDHPRPASLPSAGR